MRFATALDAPEFGIIYRRHPYMPGLSAVAERALIWSAMTLAFSHASYVEHSEIRRAPVGGFGEPDIISVRCWWEDCVQLRRGRLPRMADVNTLLAEPGLQNRLLFIDDIRRDPGFVAAGEDLERSVGQRLVSARLSALSTPADDKAILRAVYTEVASRLTPIGLNARLTVNTAPAGAFDAAYFPVASPTDGATAIIAVVKVSAYRPGASAHEPAGAGSRAPVQPGRTH